MTESQQLKELHSTERTQIFRMPVEDSIRPKTLILGLLFAAPGGMLDVGALLRGGDIFGLQGNSIRVTLTRLLNEGLIDNPERGRYRLGAKARRLGDAAAQWKQQLDRVRDCADGWILVHTAYLPRSDRAQLKTRQQALELGGFRALREGLFVRPDNLEKKLDVFRQRLCASGLDDDALLLRITEISGPELSDKTTMHDSTLRKLWDAKSRNKHYGSQTRLLKAWLKKAHTLPTDQAARESWLLGAAAIRDIVYDPLLPADWVDAKARAAYFQTVREFDVAGQTIWADCLGMREGQPP